MANTGKLDALKRAFAAADNSNKLFTEYKVSDNDNVTFSLKFGTSGVAVNTTVQLMDQFLLEDCADDVTDQAAGKGTDLLGMTMVVFSTMTKTEAMGESNTVRVDFSLSGGTEEFAHSLSQTVTAENPSVIFRIDVLFIA